MYFTFGSDECLRNGCLTVGTKQLPREHAELEAAYRSFCNQIGGAAVSPIEPRGRWLNDYSTIYALIEHFIAEDALTDLGTEIVDTPPAAMEEVRHLVEESLERLSRDEPQLGDVFRLFIHTMFYHRSSHSGGGSVSSAPGVIWCSPRINWGKQDIAEFLVHELTHNLLFVDERVHQNYKSLERIAQPKNYAISTVLGVTRPLDKVLHSYVVASEIVLFRRRFGEPVAPKVHPPTFTLRNAMARTIDSMYSLDLDQLVCKRFCEILDRVKEETSDEPSPGVQQSA